MRESVGGMGYKFSLVTRALHIRDWYAKQAQDRNARQGCTPSREVSVSWRRAAEQMYVAYVLTM